MDQKEFQSLLKRTLAIPVILIAGLAATLLWLNSRQDASLVWVDHTDQVIANSSRVMRDVTEQSSSIRGYLLTGDASFLGPFYSAQTDAAASLKQLGQSVSDDPAQLQSFQAMRASYGEWETLAQQMIAAAKSGADVRTIAANLPSKQILDRLRVQNQAFTAAEQRLRDQRVARAHADGRNEWIIAIILSFVLAIVLGVTTREHMIKISRSYLQALIASRHRSAALEETRNELNAVLSSMADGLYHLDTEGRLVYLNPAAERMLGYALEEIRGKNMHDLVHSRTPEGEHRTWEECPLRDVVTKGVPYHMDEDYLGRKDGSLFPIEATGAPLVLDGKVAGAVLTFRDLTELKRSQKALQSSDKLATAGRLATAIAHEINNPLDTVGSMLYLLQDRQADAESRQLVRDAREELARVVQITRNMLGLQRETLTPVPVRLSELLDGLLSLFERRLATSKVKVERRYESPGDICAFPGEMRQVFSNLIGNSLDAIGTRGGRILIHIYSATDWANSRRAGVRVIVADDGPGIPAQFRDNLFKPFFTTKAEKGTGLGLWVSYGIVRRHHGTMRVHTSTRPGHSGTAFAIFLPDDFRLAQENPAHRMVS
jgi:PAS domain S-box-containing protein